MLRLSTWKILLIFVPCLWGIYGAIPHLNYAEVEKFNDAKLLVLEASELSLKTKNNLELWPAWASSNIVNLGLDLRGGAHLLVEIKLEDVHMERLNSLWPSIRKELRKNREIIGSVRRIDSTLSALNIRVEKPNNIKPVIRELEKLGRRVSASGSPTGQFKITLENEILKVSLSEVEIKRIDNLTMQQSIEIIRRRVDEAGTREPSIQSQGKRRILVQVPGIGSAEELLTLIGKTAKLSFHPVLNRNVNCEKKAQFGTRILFAEDETSLCYVVKEKSVVSGGDLTNAQPSFDQNNNPAVSFQFNPVGGRKFGDYTKENIGKPFAIVLDSKVISAPVIQSYIPGGSGIITGSFSVEESNRLAILLRAGALPAEIVVLEQRTVGPELGADSVRAGKLAAIVGGVLILVFMIVSYGIFGFFANLGLILNMALIFSIMALLGATLTLPGIAGVVLTIGMAVDANVLIFERIREEMKTKKIVLNAIESGYEKALTSIIDANVTTIIAAIILFVMGSGPIRGFSITLGIGILTSVFTAVFVTRMLIAVYFFYRRPKILTL